MAAPEGGSSEPPPPPPPPLDQRFSINCWSGPRCCSTSLMYAFAQRSDTQVLDEPLYASYLKLAGLQRPYRDQVGQAAVLCSALFAAVPPK
jgi:hypothetical protein